MVTSKKLWLRASRHVWAILETNDIHKIKLGEQYHYANPGVVIEAANMDVVKTSQLSKEYLSYTKSFQKFKLTMKQHFVKMAMNHWWKILS